jgi:hypothetical protein
VNNYALSNELNVTMDAESVTALAENGSVANYGFWNVNNAKATVRGGSFTGRGGPEAWGIHSGASGTTLEAEGVTALGENASDNNYGLNNSDQAEAMLRGGSFTARGGTYAYGIYNGYYFDSGATLEAESVTALAEDGSNASYGLWNSVGTATLRGGSFTGRGGGSGSGISTGGSNAMLEADCVTALGENGLNGNFGLGNSIGAATVRGGSFTGRGGTEAWGIYNANSGATLEVVSVTALGEDGSSNNYGLYNFTSATADVTQSVLEGATYSVLRSSGAITVSNSLLAGNAVSGTVTCVLVTRGTTISTDGSTCP